MAKDDAQPGLFPDLSAARPSSFHLSLCDAPATAAWLRALLAGAIALLVLLLPAQPAASRGEHGWAGVRRDLCAIGDRAASVDMRRGAVARGVEIRRRVDC
jgi:hypothetical protein